MFFFLIYFSKAEMVKGGEILGTLDLLSVNPPGPFPEYLFSLFVLVFPITPFL